MLEYPGVRFKAPRKPLRPQVRDKGDARDRVGGGSSDGSSVLVVAGTVGEEAIKGQVAAQEPADTGAAATAFGAPQALDAGMVQAADGGGASGENSGGGGSGEANTGGAGGDAGGGGGDGDFGR